MVTSTPAVAAEAASAVASEPAPASAPAAAPAPTKDALLTFTVDKLGAPTIHATVGSEEEKAKLLDALTAKFGADHLNATITLIRIPSRLAGSTSSTACCR